MEIAEILYTTPNPDLKLHLIKSFWRVFYSKYLKISYKNVKIIQILI